jgi:pyruvate,water dikinase
VADTIAGRMAPVSRRPAFDRFTALLVGVTIAVGERRRAVPAGPGLAAGRAIRVAGPEDGASLLPGDVLVVDAALPAFAPLLWKACALVARQGSPAAHLCEVARSLRRPAVVSVDGAWAPGPGRSAIGLDGATGEIWALDVDRDLQPG